MQAAGRTYYQGHANARRECRTSPTCFWPGQKVTYIIRKSNGLTDNPPQSNDMINRMARSFILHPYNSLKHQDISGYQLHVHVSPIVKYPRSPRKRHRCAERTYLKVFDHLLLGVKSNISHHHPWFFPACHRRPETMDVRPTGLTQARFGGDSQTSYRPLQTIHHSCSEYRAFPSLGRQNVAPQRLLLGMHAKEPSHGREGPCAQGGHLCRDC
jgi:hypothetical protein